MSASERRLHIAVFWVGLVLTGWLVLTDAPGLIVAITAFAIGSIIPDLRNAPSPPPPAGEVR